MRTSVHNIALRARSRSALDIRPIHSSALAARRVNLVAPPDPISNLRPILYDQPVPDASAAVDESHDVTLATRHSPAPSPYSMSEFSSNSENQAATLHSDMARLRKGRVDAKNHEFWAATNILFKSHLERRLAALPSTATPEETEAVKTTFHRDWVVANEARMDDWVKFWWAEIRRDILHSLRRVVTRAY